MNEGRALSARHDDDDDFVPASPLFEKHLDASSGRYYYINSVTGESTWDVPHGSHIPLSVKEHSNPTYTNAADHAGDEEDASELILVGKQHIRPKENRIDDHHSILQRRIHNNHDDESSSSSSGNVQQKQRRKTVIRSMIEIHQREKQWNDEQIKTEEAKELDDIWKQACDTAYHAMDEDSDANHDDNRKKNVAINVNWKELGYISDRIYNFAQDYTTTTTNTTNSITSLHATPLHITSLSMHGNQLTSLQRLPQTPCGQNLKRLSLASNQIQTLESSTIGIMTSLTHLNLVRNGLQSPLPSDVGNLVNLQVLELANNSLKELPPTIGMLKNVERLNLECNALTALPEEICFLRCQHLNVNGNKLTCLPTSMGGMMSSLQILEANDNCLKFIPVGLCQSSSSTLRILQLSRNYIMELPSSIINIKSLERLWLDYNKLSGLPLGFHKLKKLKQLKLEGNTNMLNPPIGIIMKGTGETLNWCRAKFESHEYKRKRNIVTYVQSVLEQIGKFKVYGRSVKDEPHESVFESNVEIDGGALY